MNRNAMNSDGEHLLDAWLDGDLDENENEQLQTWLREDAEHLRRFVEANVRHQQLRDVVRDEWTADAVRQAMSERSIPSDVRPAVRPASLRWRFVRALIAAAALLAIVLYFARPSSPRIEARVVSATNARLQGEASPLLAGDRLSLRRVKLETGSLTLALSSEVEVEFLAPVEAEFTDAMRLRLYEGRVNAEVGRRGVGFTVVTDAGEIVDLGTRFGIEADRDGECRVAVFTGKVEVRRAEGAGQQKKKPITLSEGQAARFSVLAGLRRWEQVALAARAAGIASPEYDGVIRRVRDNLGDADLHPFYGVVSGGMREGVMAYTDKPGPHWLAAPGETFPAWLDGADVVRTYYQFRNRRNYQLTLTLGQPGEVYVLHDEGQSPPDWLVERFENTGARLRVGPWHPGMANSPGVEIEADGRPYLTVAVWKCSAQPGEFQLGPPRESKTDIPAVMYGVMVKPK